MVLVEVLAVLVVGLEVEAFPRLIDLMLCIQQSLLANVTFYVFLSIVVRELAMC